jgi:glutamine synthetase
VRNLRSKARVIQVDDPAYTSIEDFPMWNFDGSSTSQSPGSSSDLILQPVNFVKDPLRGEGNFLVLCEVMFPDGTPHPSNSRAPLRAALEEVGAVEEPWIGFEQEYTLYREGRPLGWPAKGFPKPQGPYYCGVGSEDVFGRDFVERHTAMCLDAGICFYGINAEVMPGQWEFQVGYRGVPGEEVGVLQIADHLWLARWLLHRIGEEFDVQPSLSNKPMAGDWNGAGCHTNFSTKSMRAEGGLRAIEQAIGALSQKHDAHIRVYGYNLESRLTGEHETCHISEFRSGVSDRGSSIRIPAHVKEQGRGYLEDRRPGANCDPYQVAARLVKTVCALDEQGYEIGDWSLDAILTAGR